MAAGVVPFTSPKLSVLVIDDDQGIREFFQDFLSTEGFQVTTLGDPTFAIKLLRDMVFHLIVLDLMMPKIAGLDLLSQIRAIDDDISVIIITGYLPVEAITESLHHGVSACFCHPIRPADFREVIARIAKQ